MNGLPSRNSLSPLSFPQTDSSKSKTFSLPNKHHTKKVVNPDKDLQIERVSRNRKTAFPSCEDRELKEGPPLVPPAVITFCISHTTPHQVFSASSAETDLMRTTCTLNPLRHHKGGGGVGRGEGGGDETKRS